MSIVLSFGGEGVGEMVADFCRDDSQGDSVTVEGRSNGGADGKGVL